MGIFIYLRISYFPNSDLKLNLTIIEIMQLLNKKTLKENMPPFLDNPNILPSRQDALRIAKWYDPENKLKIFSTKEMEFNESLQINLDPK